MVQGWKLNWELEARRDVTWPSVPFYKADVGIPRSQVICARSHKCHLRSDMEPHLISWIRTAPALRTGVVCRGGVAPNVPTTISLSFPRTLEAFTKTDWTCVMWWNQIFLEHSNQFINYSLILFTKMLKKKNPINFPNWNLFTLSPLLSPLTSWQLGDVLPPEGMNWIFSLYILRA